MNHKRFFKAAVIAVFSMVGVFASAQQATSGANTFGAGVLLANSTAIITQVPHVALEDLLAFGGEEALLMAWRGREASKNQIQAVKATAKAPSWAAFDPMINTQILQDAAVLLGGDAAIISQVQHIALEDLLEFGGEESLLMAWYGKLAMK